MRYLSLRRLASTPTRAPSSIDVRLYADTDGALKTVDHDGTVDELGGGGGEQLVQSQAFSLTAQQIKDSTLTPVEIVPAQGAGTLVVPTMYVFKFQAGATPYNSAYLELVIGDFNANTLATFLTSAADDVGWVFGARNIDTGAFIGVGESGAPADYLNQPIRLRAGLRGSIASTFPPFEAGTGYAVGDTGIVDDGSPNATYVIDTIGGGGAGAVLTFSITDGGDGYSLAAGGGISQWTTTPAGAQPGGGSGLIIQVDAINASGSAGDGTLSGVVYYVVADLT